MRGSASTAARRLSRKWTDQGVMRPPLLALMIAALPWAFAAGNPVNDQILALTESQR